MTQIRVEGVDRLLKDLQRLDRKMKGKALQDAAKAGAVVFRDAARDLAPRRAGAKGGRLRRDIEARRLPTPGEGVTFGVSWRVGKASRTPAFYGLFIHKGTPQRKRKSGGSTGRVSRPRPFLTQAYDQNRDAADRAVADVLRRAVEGAV